MTLTDFDDGYYYATELKKFARSLGVPGVSHLRKDQLEELIREYLRTGQVQHDVEAAPPSTAGLDKDSSRPLTMDTPIRRYTNDKVTKSFLFAQARRANPKFKQKSGAMYWINRWREAQIADGVPLTYGDLVDRFVELNKTRGRLPRIPSTRYNNFISDYLADQHNATRSQAIDAWDRLKEMSTPKTYEAWKERTDPRPTRTTSEAT